MKPHRISPTGQPETIAKPSAWKQLLGYPAPVYVLVVGTFFNRLGFFVVPYMALYLSQLGYSIEQVGGCMAAYGAGTVVASVVGGHLADTLGRKRTIVLSMMGSGVMVLLLSQVQTLPLFMAVAFLAAMFAESYRPASHALIADLIEDRDRIMVYALLRWAINAGWAMGPALAGVLVKVSYTWIFVGDALTSLLFGVLAMRCLPAFGKHREVPLRHVLRAFSSMKLSMQTAFADRRFLQVFLASFPIAFIFNQTLSTLSLEVRDRGFSELDYGLILGLNGVIIILTEIPLSLWVKNQSPRLMMVIGYALIGLGFGLFVLGEGRGPLYAGIVVFTIGEMMALPVALAYMIGLAPAEMRGRYMGVWGLSWSVTMMLATSLGLQLHARMGGGFWLLMAGLGLLSACIMLRRIVPPPTQANLKT